MKCDQCVEAGLTSRIYPGPTTSTCMATQPYYDEDGRYHHHDGNWRTTSYTCGYGHRFVRQFRPGCSVPGCIEPESQTLTRPSHGHQGVQLGDGLAIQAEGTELFVRM